jgi:hypothetical protein
MGTRAGAARGTDRYQAAREKAMRRPGVDPGGARAQGGRRAGAADQAHPRWPRDLQIDDSTWRSYLQAAFSCSSSTELPLPSLRTAMEHLKRRGFTPKPAGAAARQPHEWTWVDTAPADRAPLLRKVIKLMQQTDVSLGNQMDYVEGIARQMGGLNAAGVHTKIHKPLSMCDAEQLLSIVKALAIHLKRQQSHAQPTADA